MPFYHNLDNNMLISLAMADMGIFTRATVWRADGEELNRHDHWVAAYFPQNTVPFLLFGGSQEQCAQAFDALIALIAAGKTVIRSDTLAKSVKL